MSRPTAGRAGGLEFDKGGACGSVGGKSCRSGLPLDFFQIACVAAE